MASNLTVNDFLDNKSVKLSDAYRVSIKNNTSVEGVNQKNPFNFYLVFDNCVSVKIPEYRPNTNEIVKYRNKEVKLKMPNYEDSPTLTLQFYESPDLKMRKLINVFLRNFNFDEETSERIAINPYLYIDNIQVEILSNDLATVKHTYIFNYCKLVNYSYDYTLDYASGSLPLVTMEFYVKQFGFK